MISEARLLGEMTPEQRAEWVADVILGRRTHSNSRGVPMTRDNPLWRDIRSRALAALRAEGKCSST